MKRSSFPAIFLLLSAACGDAGPEVETSEIIIVGFLTAVDQVNDTTEVETTIIGRPGATSNTGTVEVSNPRSAATVSGEVSSVGSFVLQIPALEDDVLKLTHTDGTEIYAGEIIVMSLPDFPQIAAGGLTATVPHTDLHTVVVEVTTSADVNVGEIMVSDPTNHHVNVLTQLSPTYFVGHLPSQSGHSLLVHYETGGQASRALQITVP